MDTTATVVHKKPYQIGGADLNLCFTAPRVLFTLRKCSHKMNCRGKAHCFYVQ